MIGSVSAGVVTEVSSWVSGPLLLALPVAMLAGLLSFLSPCVLPLVPGYLSYVTGLTGAELAGDAQDPQELPGQRVAGQAAGMAVATAPPRGRSRRVPLGRSRVLVGTLGFVLGFSAVFVSYGALFGGLGSALASHQALISRVLGVVVIVLGLGFLGVNWLPWLSGEARWRARPRRGLWGAPFLGVLFGLGWTPCIGPTLATVQALAFTQASALRGAILGLAYCLGLGLPFLVLGLAFERGMGAVRWFRAHSRAVTRFGGAMLVTIGVLMVLGVWGHLVTWLQVRTAGWVAPL